MKSSLVAPFALVAAAVLVVVILISGGEDPYVAKLRMANAGGLKDGSPVTVGGVTVGKVDVDVDVPGDVAVAELRIQKKFAPIGRDASATIVAQNLLGQKSVQVAPGDAKGDPAPDGFVIPVGRITEATDLDRVLSVLDADTRARLAIFVNEAGTAFTGRRADFNKFLRDIAPAIANGTDLVRELGADNQRLKALLGQSDRFVAAMEDRRDDVVRFVDRVGEAAEAASGKRVELRQTLAQTPGALGTLRAFLTELRKASRPLGPAARRLSASSTPLRQALDQLEPFRAAAEPALETARSVAPTLERLAVKATPVIRSAAPTAAALRKLSADELPPITTLTDRSLNNTLAVVDNWAGAIQYRDRLSHIFRGEASFALDAIVSAVERISPTPVKTKTRERTARKPAQSPAAPGLGQAPKLPSVKLPGLPEVPLPGLPKVIQDTVGGVLKGLAGTGSGSRSGSSERAPEADLTNLFDFLMR
jgi:virulence factor Mce-like protein